MSLDVSYFQKESPVPDFDYPVEFHKLIETSDAYITDHLSKVIVATCVRADLRAQFMDRITITDIGTGHISKNTVLWVGALIGNSDQKTWVLINTPQLKTFEPYFVDSKIIRSGVMRFTNQIWRCELAA